MTLRVDPQERNPKLRRIIRAAEVEAEHELQRDGDWKSQMGYCHILWDRQKQILKEKYGLDWKTPAEMNPDVIFD